MTGDLTGDLWVYPLRWGETLRTNDWVEWQFHEFLTSSFVAYTVYEDSRAEGFTAMLLWSESYRQDPAGTLPCDDVELMGLARVKSMTDWLAMRALVMRGWQRCVIEGDRQHAGARLGQPLIATIAAQSYRRKSGRAQGREAAKLAQIKFKLRKKLIEMGRKKLADQEIPVLAMARWLENAQLSVTAENVGAALAEIGAGGILVFPGAAADG